MQSDDHAQERRVCQKPRSEAGGGDSGLHAGALSPLAIQAMGKATAAFLHKQTPDHLAAPILASILPNESLLGFASDARREAPMPVQVVAVDLALGDKVETGQRLAAMEAMKMQRRPGARGRWCGRRDRGGTGRSGGDRADDRKN